MFPPVAVACFVLLFNLCLANGHGKKDKKSAKSGKFEKRGKKASQKAGMTLITNIQGNHNIQCDPFAAYRSLDGSCNNLMHPDLGVGHNTTGTLLDTGIYVRLEQPEYVALGDDINLKSPREQDGPTPIQVGVDLVGLPDGTTKSPTDSVYNTLLVFVTQFVVHDIADTEIVPFDPFGPNGLKLPDKQGHLFTLGQPSVSLLDDDGVAHQFNLATSFIDLSQIYGTTPMTTKALRAGVDGLMKTTEKKQFTKTYKNFPNQQICHCINTTTGETVFNFEPDGSNAHEMRNVFGFRAWVPEPYLIPGPDFGKCFSPISFDPALDLGVYTCNFQPFGGPQNILIEDVSCMVDFDALNDESRSESVWDLPEELEYPPFIPELDARIPFSITFSGSNDGSLAFAFGDPRNSENLAQLALSMMFLREHNHRARSLKAQNPGWDDETLYQEARKWCIAVAQQMWYKEVLPILVGSDEYRQAEFHKKYNGESDYDDTLDPRISNSFAAAGFRLHSMIPNVVFLVDPENVNDPTTGGRIVASKVPLFVNYFAPGNPGPRVLPYLHQAGGGQTSAFAAPPELLAWQKSQLPEHINEPNEAVIAGLLNQLAPKLDHVCEKSMADIDISGCLDRNLRVSIPGMSTFRARFHGIPNYHTLRVFYTGNSLYGEDGCPDHSDDSSSLDDPLACFELLTGGDTSLAQTVRDAYGRLDKIDPWYGLMVEQSSFRESDALLSRTAAQIVIEQMWRLKHGDRFWYESDIHGWSDEEKQELEERTLAAMIQHHFPALNGKVNEANIFHGRWDYES